MKGVLAVLFLSIATAWGENPERIVTTDGRVFEGVSALKVSAHKIRFLHRDGAASVRLEDLDPALRESFGYDAGKAAAAAAEEERAAARNEAAIAAAAQSVADEGEARRKAVLALKEKDFGGRVYWMSEKWLRDSRDQEASRILAAAGCSPQQAAGIIARLKQEGRKAKYPPLDPEFTRARGRLRGTVEGYQK